MGRALLLRPGLARVSTVIGPERNCRQLPLPGRTQSSSLVHPRSPHTHRQARRHQAFSLGGSRSTRVKGWRPTHQTNVALRSGVAWAVVSCLFPFCVHCDAPPAPGFSSWPQAPPAALHSLSSPTWRCLSGPPASESGVRDHLPPTTALREQEPVRLPLAIPARGGKPPIPEGRPRAPSPQPLHTHRGTGRTPAGTALLQVGRVVWQRSEGSGVTQCLRGLLPGFPLLLGPALTRVSPLKGPPSGLPSRGSL